MVFSQLPFIPTQKHLQHLHRPVKKIPRLPCEREECDSILLSGVSDSLKEKRMGKQGGQGKGKPKLKDKNFGKALIRQQTIGYQGS